MNTAFCYEDPENPACLPVGDLNEIDHYFVSGSFIPSLARLSSEAFTNHTCRFDVAWNSTSPM